MSRADPGATGLRRELGPFSATCVVIGAIIGVGIFFTPSRVVEVAGRGDLALLAWCGGGVIALLGALCFAELGAMFPRAGAQYEVLRDAYGPLPAFAFVFCNATWIQAGATAIIAVVCVQNLSQALQGGAPEGAPLIALATLLIVALALANALGVRVGARIQNATVVAKLLALLSIAALAAWMGEGEVLAEVDDRAQPAGPWPVLLFAAMVPTLFSFGGWQQALWMAGEVRDAERVVPRSILYGVGVVIASYLLVNVAYLRLLGPGGVARSDVLAADAVAAVFPALGERLVALAVAFSAFGVLNAQLLAGPRLVYAMARDGRFFDAFAAVHARFRTPVAAILMIASLACLLLVVAGRDGTDALLTGVVLVDGVFFVLTGAAVMRLRSLRPGASRPVRVPLYPWVPIAFCVLESAVVAGSFVDPAVRQAALIGVAWIAGASVLFWMRFSRSGPGRVAP